ncbi:MAG TPA: hypothetical protein VGE09_06530 [Pseudoxanthomonas sp.]
MFNINPVDVAIGFALCAVLCCKYPKVALVVNTQAARLIAFGVRIWKGRKS